VSKLPTIYQTFFAPSNLWNTHPKFRQQVAQHTWIWELRFYGLLHSQYWQLLTTTHCVITQSAVLIYFAAEAWNHTHIFNNIQTQHLNVSTEILLTSCQPFTSFDPPWLQPSVYASHCSRPYIQLFSAGHQGLLLSMGFTVSSVWVRCLGIAKWLQSSDHSNPTHSIYQNTNLLYLATDRHNVRFNMGNNNNNYSHCSLSLTFLSNHWSPAETDC
jgi:hypothetical protein